MEPGSRWKHYKGGEYVVAAWALLEATGETMVVYVKEVTPGSYPYGEYWVRPLAEWHQEVSPGVRRFTEVKGAEVG